MINTDVAVQQPLVDLIEKLSEAPCVIDAKVPDLARDLGMKKVSRLIGTKRTYSMKRDVGALATIKGDKPKQLSENSEGLMAKRQMCINH